VASLRVGQPPATHSGIKFVTPTRPLRPVPSENLPTQMPVYETGASMLPAMEHLLQRAVAVKSEVVGSTRHARLDRKSYIVAWR